MIFQKDFTKALKYSNEIGLLGDNVLPSGKTEITDLVERGYIETLGKGRDMWSMDNMLLTDKFTKGLLIEDEKKAALELWYIYPDYLYVNGASIPAKVYSQEEFITKYMKAINNDFALHQKILKLVREYTKTHSYAQMNIRNFLDSRHWEILDKENNGGTNQAIRIT